jgi:hypothetical protein
MSQDWMKRRRRQKNEGVPYPYCHSYSCGYIKESPYQYSCGYPEWIWFKVQKNRNHGYLNLNIYYDYMNTILGPLWALIPLSQSHQMRRPRSRSASSAPVLPHRPHAWPPGGSGREVCLEKDPENPQNPFSISHKQTPKKKNGAKLCLNRNTMSLCQLNHKSPFWITYI